MAADEVSAWRRNQRGEAAHELGGLQKQYLAAVTERPLQPINEPAVGQLGQPLLRKGGAGAVTAQTCEPFSVIRVQCNRGMEREAITEQFGEVQNTGRILGVTLELRSEVFRWQLKFFSIDSRAVEHPSLVAGPVFKTGEVRREAFLASSIPVLYRQLSSSLLQLALKGGARLQNVSIASDLCV